jgi:ketosteroid isomerase-like protein
MTTNEQSNLERLTSALLPFADTDLVLLFRSEGGVANIRDALEEIAAPDLVTLMIGSERGLTGTFHGPAGFIEAWQDFTATFRELRQEILDLTETEGGAILAETRQVGTTATGDVELQYEAAAVFRFSGGQLQQAEFHLDRAAARRAVGLSPHDAPD